MSPTNSYSYARLQETIAIPKSPEIPSEFTMRKYRIIIEDADTGQEFKGYDKLNRVACERIIAIVDSVGAHEIAEGKLPVGKNRERKMSQWARDVAHVFDRKPPRPAPKRRAPRVKGGAR